MTGVAELEYAKKLILMLKQNRSYEENDRRNQK